MFFETGLFKNEYEKRVVIENLLYILESDDLTEEEIRQWLEDELVKPENERDYTLIHECKLTLSECFGDEYNNEYAEAARIASEKIKAEYKAKKELRN